MQASLRAHPWVQGARTGSDAGNHVAAGRLADLQNLSIALQRLSAGPVVGSTDRRTERAEDSHLTNPARTWASGRLTGSSVWSGRQETDVMRGTLVHPRPPIQQVLPLYQLPSVHRASPGGLGRTNLTRCFHYA